MSYENLSAEKIAELKEAFKIFDQNGTGIITVEQLGTVMRSIGLNPTTTQLQEMLAEVGVPESGFVDFSEFVKIMILRSTQYSQSEKDIREAFRVFDREGKGYITSEELRNVLTSLGDKFTKEQFNEVVRQADADGDGFISFEDFLNVLKQNK